MMRHHTDTWRASQKYRKESIPPSKIMRAYPLMDRHAVDFTENPFYFIELVPRRYLVSKKFVN